LRRSDRPGRLEFCQSGIAQDACKVVRSSRARPWERSLARTRTVVSRTIFTDADDNRAACCGWPQSGFPRLPLGSRIDGGRPLRRNTSATPRFVTGDADWRAPGVDGADGDDFVIQHAAAQHAFNSCLRVEEVRSLPSDYVMASSVSAPGELCSPALAKVPGRQRRKPRRG